MRRIAVLLGGLLAAASASAQIVWIEPVHDFGAIREDRGLARTVFRGVNVGTDTIVVLSARANCGCTRPEFSRGDIPPGDTVKVGVAFDPAGRPGRFEKKVMLTTTAPSRREVLEITGTVIGASSTLEKRFPIEVGQMRLSNTVVALGETTKGHVLGGSVLIYNPTDSAVIPAAAHLPPYIRCTFSPAEIPAGEQAVASLTAFTDRCPQYGTVENTFTLIPDIANPSATATISTVMIVHEDFSRLTPEQRDNAPGVSADVRSVEFGVINRGGKKTSRTFELTNTGRSPLIIRQLHCPDGCISAKAAKSEVKPGKKVQVTVTLDPQKLPGGQPLNTTLTIVTNSPADPRLILRVVGE